MGIFGALNTAVGGMKAQSYSLENVSGNIANSQTTGFKRIDTSFSDIIAENIPSKQLAGGVTASARMTNTIQGDIQSVSVGTFMAINGEGFFVVQKPTGTQDNNPSFGGADLYTRRGDFQPDKNGYLVNGAGYYLMGIPVDPATGNATGSVPELLKFQNDLIPAQPTTEIEYRANLPKTPFTADYDPKIPGSELLSPASSTVIADDVTAFLDASIGGGAVTAFDVSGAAVNLQVRWAKVSSAATGGTDTWNLFYETNSAATGTEPAWVNAGVDYTFAPDGQMDPVVSTAQLSGVTVDGVTLGDIQILHGSGGITQFSDSSGDVRVNLLQQNGFAAGELESISISDKGRVVGSYSNGRTIDLAEITLATFSGANFLKRLDGGAFEATAESGTPIYGASGTIVGSSLEGSNVDIADEFTKLIVTQQAYSANTRVISTANDMVGDMLNMLR